MLERSTMKAIHLMRKMIEYYWARKRELHVVYINLKKPQGIKSNLVGNDKEGHTQEIH